MPNDEKAYFDLFGPLENTAPTPREMREAVARLAEIAETFGLAEVAALACLLRHGIAAWGRGFRDE